MLARLNGIDIYYRVTGGGPPLLLINGLGCDTRLFGPLTTLLKGSFTVINYDQQQAGRSGKPGRTASIAELAEEALGLLARLGISKTSVFGFSMGGMIAMELAAGHPGTVDRLFLVSTAPSINRPFPVSKDIKEMMHSTEITDGLLTDVFLNFFGPDYRKKIPVGAYLDFRHNDPEPQPASAYLRQLETLDSADLSNRAGRIVSPTLLFAGSEDRVIPPANSRWLNQRIRTSRIEMVKGAGHMLPVEVPEILANGMVKHYACQTL